MHPAYKLNILTFNKFRLEIPDRDNFTMHCILLYIVIHYYIYMYTYTYIRIRMTMY